MPLSAPPFISRADLGNVLGEDLSASEAALIAVDAACDLVRMETEQTFNAIPNDEIVLDGSGTDALLLPELPVTAVDSVQVGDDDPLVVADDYKLNGRGVLLRVPSPAVWTKGRQNVTVSYDHGYADADLPRDVREIALRIAARLYRQPSTAGVSSKSLGSFSVSYVTNQADQGDLFTAMEKLHLRKYKR